MILDLGYSKILDDFKTKYLFNIPVRFRLIYYFNISFLL